MAAVVRLPARVACALCGPLLQDIATSRPLQNTHLHAITCVRLSCGHDVHRTIKNIGGIFPGSTRNATFGPCDCP
jgi:hypothetical protein